jgi:hypothetical protein
MGRFFSTVVIVAVFLGLIYGMHYGFYSLLSRQGMFDLRDIRVSGNGMLKASDIIQGSGLVYGQSIFSINLAAVSKNILADRMVQSAVVTLLPPDRVDIKVEERKPAAVVSMDNNYYVCDKDGFIIENGVISTIPHVVIDFQTGIEANQLKNDYLLAVIANLAEFADSSELKSLIVKQKEGLFITVRGCEDTTFYAGNNIPDDAMFKKVLVIAKKIKSDKMSIKYIDMNKDNVIGFK